MSEPSAFLADLSDEAVWRLEETCSRFEEAWLSGRRPRVEDALADTAEPERTALLRELLRLELYYRRAAGETARTEEYAARFPEAGGVLAEVFAASGSVETADLSTPAEDVAADAPVVRTRPDARPAPAGAAGADQRYRPLRFHAAGNLGEVHIAEDVELNREVALKEIQARHAHRRERHERFRLEGEVTGRLEHPGIVPVYGMGTYPDGRPFYAMRFIRGETLAAAIARFHAGAAVGFDSIEFRQLLGRFLAVCQAVGYAHSRGVLHRDLKPANVMLGTFGETLVVDWGLAKVMALADQAPQREQDALNPPRAGCAETEAGAVMGTPAFMSPEQAAGRVNELGPETDVYALGATLYALLTNRAPVSGPVTEVLARVQGGEWPPPRRVLATVPAALEAVCLKAMALAPDGRYPSATALAADVERWLADEPVTAHREPRVARMRRWVRKHPRSVTAVGVALVAAVLGMTVVAGLIEKGRNDAKKQFALTRDAVRKFLVSVNEDDLLHEPGMQPLRQKLLTDALNYYDEFLKARPGDPDVLQEQAEANRQLGELYAEAGRFELAAPRIAWSIEGFDALRARGRDTGEVRRGLGRAHLARAALPEAEGGGLATADRAVELLTAVTAESPEDPAALRLLGRAHQVRSAVLARAGQLDRALDDNAKAGRACWSAAFIQFQEYPGSNNVVLRLRGDGDEPRGYFLASYQVLSAWLDRGSLLELAGRKAEAASAYATAACSARWLRDHYSYLQAYHPRRTRLSIALAEALLGLGRMETDLGRPAAAKSALEQARDLIRGFLLDAPTPEARRYNELLGQVNGYLGECLLALGQTARAGQLLREAEAQSEPAPARAGAAHLTLKRQARALAALARSADEVGRVGEAVRYAERARALQDRAVALAPWDLDLQSDRLDVRELLARARSRSGAPGRDEHIGEQRRLLDERSELARRHAGLFWLRAKVGASAAALSRLQLDAGRTSEALATADAALPDHERAVRDDELGHRLAGAAPVDPTDGLGARAAVSRLDLEGYPRHFTTRQPAREPEDLTLRRAGAELLAAKAAALAASDRPAAAECLRRACAIAEGTAGGGAALPGPPDLLQPRWAALALAHARREPAYLLDLARYLAQTSTLSTAGDEAGRAVEALGDFVATGFDAPAALAADPRLAPLRDRADFRRLTGDPADQK